MRVFDLTKAQVRAYLEEQAKAGGKFAPAGNAADQENCPLARAYQYAHPRAKDVSITRHTAYINGEDYDLRHWQVKFVRDVDAVAWAVPNKFEEGAVITVSIDYCLSLLDGGEA